jgi:hypothetical protein
MELPKFNTKEELHKYLITNKSQIIEMKKSEIKYCDPVKVKLFKDNNVANKAITSNLNKDTDEVIERTIVGNTYYWVDHHEDIHVSGNFAKSIKERPEKIFHLHDHEFKLTSKVGEPISFREDSIKWSDLGVNKEGYTEALMMDSQIIKDYNTQIFKLYKEGKIDQHSVGIRYIKLDLAINDPDEKNEFANWEKYYHLLGNPERADELGYFFIVLEAKLIEISAVLAGSNELTPTLENDNKLEPFKNTQEEINEPSDDTQTDKVTQFYLGQLKN